MSVSEGFKLFVLDQLQDLELLSTRRLFGAVAIYYDSLIFALIIDDILYLKVGPENVEDYIKAGMSPFKPFKDKPMVMSYYEVPADVLEDRKKLIQWVKKSYLASEAALTKKLEAKKRRDSKRMKGKNSRK